MTPVIGLIRLGVTKALSSHYCVCTFEMAKDSTERRSHWRLNSGGSDLQSKEEPLETEPVEGRTYSPRRSHWRLNQWRVRPTVQGGATGD